MPQLSKTGSWRKWQPAKPGVQYMAMQYHEYGGNNLNGSVYQLVCNETESEILSISVMAAKKYQWHGNGAIYGMKAYGEMARHVAISLSSANIVRRIIIEIMK